MKRRLWLHDDGKQIVLRGPGPFAPVGSLVEVELEQEDEGCDIIRKVVAAYDENDIPVPEAARDYLNQKGETDGGQ